jgi:hypothetical protein
VASLGESLGVPHDATIVGDGIGHQHQDPHAGRIHRP